MTLSVARGAASPSGMGAEGSMAAIVIRKADGMSGRAGIATSPEGTSRPYMAMGMSAVILCTVWGM